MEQVHKRHTIAITPCESSRIHGHGDDEASQTLALQFKGKEGPGSVYHYSGFPKDKYAELCAAESIGKFFGAEVNAKDVDPENPDAPAKPRYPYTKIGAA